MFNFLKKKKNTFKVIKYSKNPEEYLKKINSVASDGFWDILSVPFNFPIENTIPVFWGEDEDDYVLSHSFTDEYGFGVEMKPKSFKLISDLMEHYNDKDINFSYIAFDKKNFRKNNSANLVVVKKEDWNNKSINLLYEEYRISSTFGSVLFFGGSGNWAMVLEPEDDFGYFGSRDNGGVKIFLDQISDRKNYFKIIDDKLIQEKNFTAEIIKYSSKQKVKLWKSWLKTQIEYLKEI